MCLNISHRLLATTAVTKGWRGIEVGRVPVLGVKNINWMMARMRKRISEQLWTYTFKSANCSMYKMRTKKGKLGKRSECRLTPCNIALPVRGRSAYPRLETAYLADSILHENISFSAARSLRRLELNAAVNAKATIGTMMMMMTMIGRRRRW